MKKLLEGKKTFIGIAIAVLGMTGAAAFISPDESEALFNAIFQIVGIAVAVYGRVVAKG